MTRKQTTPYVSDEEVLAWALKNSIYKIEVGYTMTSEDTADEWVKLSSSSGLYLYVYRSQFQEYFNAGIGPSRTIARLKQRAEAEYRVKEQQQKKHEQEIAQMKHLAQKHGYTVEPTGEDQWTE